MKEKINLLIQGLLHCMERLAVVRPRPLHTILAVAVTQPRRVPERGIKNRAGPISPFSRRA